MTGSSTQCPRLTATIALLTIRVESQLEGSSAISFSSWTHTSQQDIDDWGQLGNPGRFWKELFPYFLKSENYNAPPTSVPEQVDTTFIGSHLHGENSPVQDFFSSFYGNFYKAWEPTYKSLGLGPTLPVMRRKELQLALTRR